jgi:DNA-binding MarR family transcriptional regulator
LDGLRPIELAERLRITKQSVNDLLGHLEQHGYLIREPDPADRRARVLRLTAKGQHFE